MDAGQRCAAYLDLLAAARTARTTATRQLAPVLEGARFKLGTSVADHVVPYAVDEDVHALFRAALADLAWLYVSRNRVHLGEAVYDAVLLHGGERPVATRPPSYAPPPQVRNPTMAAAMARAPRILPGLDAGVLAAWWGGEGRGRDLLKAWSGLLSRALDEGSRTPEEETGYLVQWMLHDAFAAALEVPALGVLDEAPRREVLAALLLGLHLAHHLTKAHALGGRITRGEPFAVRWAAAMSPRVTFRPAQSSLAWCTFNPVRAEVLGARRDLLLQRLDDADAEDPLAEVTGWLGQDRELRRQALGQLARHRLRERVLDVVAAGLPERTGPWTRLWSFLRAPRSLDAVLDEKRARKELVAELRAEAKEARARPDLSRRLEELAEAVKRHDASDPARTAAASGDEAVHQAAVSLVADAGDALIERASYHARKRLVLRTGKETDRALADEWAAGRLYRVGLGSAPLLEQRASVAEVGHYFIDLKDYTRRTALLKEAVMADFIRREFYEPILRIAGEHHHGLRQLADRGGVHLNNLLGDAVSLSGDVAALVRIARDIRRHLEGYARTLSARLDREDLARRVGAVKAQHRAALAPLMHRRRELEEERNRLAAAGALDAEATRALLAQLRDVEGEVRRLNVERDDALAQLTGQHLMSGSFVSHGAVATVVTFDDAVWGAVQVAIAEKINESARGTARTGSVLAAVEAVRDWQRRRTGHAELELPFRVYVGNSLGLPLSPQDELALRGAFLAGEADRAVEIYGRAARDHVQRTTAGGPSAVEAWLEAGMALYNAGDALSGEALTAYREAAGRQVRFADASVALSELEPELRRRYVFLEPRLRLVVGVSLGEVTELFHYAGTVRFKGFERTAPTEVWEMMDLESDPGRLLAASAALRRAARVA